MPDSYLPALVYGLMIGGSLGYWAGRKVAIWKHKARGYDRMSQAWPELTRVLRDLLQEVKKR